MQGLALDPERARIYVQDMARNKILALDSRGSEVFTIDHPNAIAVAVDPKIGEIWVIYDESYSKWGLKGGTAVYDPSGARLAVHPWGGGSIVFHRFDDSFWVAGAEVFKVDRNGKKLTSGPDRPGCWCFPSHPIIATGQCGCLEACHQMTIGLFSTLTERESSSERCASKARGPPRWLATL